MCFQAFFFGHVSSESTIPWLPLKLCTWDLMRCVWRFKSLLHQTFWEWPRPALSFQIGHYFFPIDCSTMTYYCNTMYYPWRSTTIESSERINCWSFRWSWLLLVWPVGFNTLGTVPMRKRSTQRNFLSLSGVPSFIAYPTAIEVIYSSQFWLGILLQILKYSKPMANSSQ